MDEKLKREIEDHPYLYGVKLVAVLWGWAIVVGFMVMIVRLIHSNYDATSLVAGWVIWIVGERVWGFVVRVMFKEVS